MTGKFGAAVPLDDATRYIIVSETDTHGDEWRRQADVGATAFRKSQSLRGWITETDALVALGEDGDPQSIPATGGPAAQHRLD